MSKFTGCSLFFTLLAIVVIPVAFYASYRNSHVLCEHATRGAISCTISSNDLLSLFPTEQQQVNGVIRADIVEHCDDSCGIRTELVTQNGDNVPIQEILTDDDAKNTRIVNQINAFIDSPEQSQLEIDDVMDTRLIVLILTIIGLFIGTDLVILLIRSWRKKTGQNDQ